MIPSNELFSLIKALSKNEKGYFKKFSALNAGKESHRYVRMFDEIEQQDEYNEGRIKEKRGTQQSRNFAPEKNYLFRMLLRSLNQFNYDSGSDHQLRELLNSVEILYAKTLYKSCLKLLNKAESLAEAYEKFNYIPQIVDWKFRVLPALGDMEELKKYIAEGEKSKQRAIDLYNNLSNYRLLESKMFYLTKTVGYPRNKQEEEKYRVLIHEPFLQNINKAKSFWAKFHYYNILNFYYDAVGKKDKLYQVRKQLIDFAETDPLKLEDDRLRYLVALNNLVNTQDELDKTSEVQETLRKIRNVKSRSTDIQIKVFVYSYTLEESANIMRGQFQRNIDHWPEVERGLKKFRGKMHKEYLLAFRYNFFCSYFGVEKFSLALHWLNEILNDKTADYRRELYSVARIMFLIVHYELDNETLLDYALKNARRFFTSRGRLYKFEEIMLNFMERISSVNRKKKLKEEFVALKAELDEIRSDPFESQPLNFFDFDAWVESKIEGKKFGTRVRERWEQQKKGH